MVFEYRLKIIYMKYENYVKITYIHFRVNYCEISIIGKIVVYNFRVLTVSCVIGYRDRISML